MSLFLPVSRLYRWCLYLQIYNYMQSFFFIGQCRLQNTNNYKPIISIVVFFFQNQGYCGKLYN